MTRTYTLTYGQVIAGNYFVDKWRSSDLNTI